MVNATFDGEEIEKGFFRLDDEEDANYSLISFAPFQCYKVPSKTSPYQFYLHYYSSGNQSYSCEMIDVETEILLEACQSSKLKPTFANTQPSRLETWKKLSNEERPFLQPDESQQQLPYAFILEGQQSEYVFPVPSTTSENRQAYKLIFTAKQGYKLSAIQKDKGTDITDLITHWRKWSTTVDGSPRAPTSPDDHLWLQQLYSFGVATLEGVAGVGKTHNIGTCINFLKEKCGCEVEARVLVMHPSSSYEQLIFGIRVQTRSKSTETTELPFEFAEEPGTILQALKDALETFWQGESKSKKVYLVVLDEINRCNLPSVLGELIFLIEPSKRVSENDVVSSKIERSPENLESFKKFLLQVRKAIHIGPDIYCIPENLYVLGTMNSSDRSILGFDQALRRRFPPYRLEPMAKDALLNKFGNLDPESPLVKGVEAWASLNVFLRFVIGPDAMIGHSYWFDANRKGGDEESCDHAWRFGVLPQAIHAAESARKELFLAALFKADFTELLNNHLSPDDRSPQGWKEAMIACGSKDLLRSDTEKDQKELLEKLHENIRTRGHVVEFAGAGHGEKLLIRKKDA